MDNFLWKSGLTHSSLVKKNPFGKDHKIQPIKLHERACPFRYIRTHTFVQKMKMTFTCFVS